MFNNNNFYGGAASSGGGFMPSSQATPTTAYGVSPAKSRDSQGWLPLTINQLSDCITGGVDVGNVKVVGTVFDKVERINEVTFTIVDETGQIDCRKWVNDMVDKMETSEIKNGTFAEIRGHLKGFRDKKHLEVFSVRMVSDIDQVAHHFKDMYIHSDNTNSQGQGNNSAQPQISYQTDPLNPFYCQPTAAGISQKVLDCLSVPAHMTPEKGMHVTELAQHLNIPLVEIMEAIEHLEEDGKVYSTIDEFHFKSSSIIDIHPSFSEINQKVLEFLSIPAHMAREDGVHRDELVHYLNVPLEKIMKALATLAEEGVVYPTIDEHHYKPFGEPVTNMDLQPILAGLDQKVLEFLSAPALMVIEQGVSVNELAEHFKIPPKKIMEAIRHLEEEGLAYSTIDEFHYRSATW